MNIALGTSDRREAILTTSSIGTVAYDHHTLREVQEVVEATRYPALTLTEVGRQGVL